MKKLLLTLFLLAGISHAKPKEDTLVLTERNTIVLNWTVSEESIARLTQQLLEKSQDLRDDEPIYLVLDTPGGSINAGNSFITAAKAIKQEVKTINLFSASMGFQIAQNLGERLVVENGILMSHRAAGGFRGQFPGELDTQFNFWKGITKRLDVVASNRMDMSLEEYRSLIHDEYWVEGKQAVEDGAADRLVSVTCDKTLSGSADGSLETPFGTLRYKYSKCPIARGFYDVGFSLQTYPVSMEAIQYRQMLFNLVNDKESFVENYIVNGAYQHFFK